MTRIAWAFLIAIGVLFVGFAALPSTNTALGGVDTTEFNTLITVAVKAFPYLAIGFILLCAWVAWRRG